MSFRNKVLNTTATCALLGVTYFNGHHAGILAWHPDASRHWRPMDAIPVDNLPRPQGPINPPVVTTMTQGTSGGGPLNGAQLTTIPRIWEEYEMAHHRVAIDAATMTMRRNAALFASTGHVTEG